MVLALKNRTRFATDLAPGLDAHGTEHAVVVVKGTFSAAPGKDLALAEEQLPVAWGDTFHGKVGQSSLRVAGDAALRKPGTDLYVVGAAKAAGRPATHVDVGLAVGSSIRKVLRVFGDRRWERTLGTWSATPPAPFESMPVTWERAYGGREP